MNSLYLRDTVNIWNEANINGVLTGFSQWLRESTNTMRHPMMRLTAIEGRNLGVEGGEYILRGEDNPGIRAGNALSSMTCLLEQIRCDSGGSPLKGRNFWPWGTEDDLHGNVWSENMRTEARNSLDYLPLSVAGGPAALVRVSRVLNGVLRPVALTNTYSSYDVRKLVAVQRDRRF
jgi:hypothetical protein